MTTQHYRITLAEDLEHHKKRWITSTALLYYYLKIRLARGIKCTIQHKQVTKKLEIALASFCRAIAPLECTVYIKIIVAKEKKKIVKGL